MIDKESLAGKIKEEIKLTRQKISDLSIDTKPISPENAIGRISRMDAINNKSVSDAALRNLQQKLKKLELALQKLPEKSFGKCIKCGQEIAEGRLMLMPESNRCIKCA